MKDQKAGRGTSAAPAKGKAPAAKVAEAKETSKAKPAAKATDRSAPAATKTVPAAAKTAPAATKTVPVAAKTAPAATKTAPGRNGATEAAALAERTPQLPPPRPAAQAHAVPPKQRGESAPAARKNEPDQARPANPVLSAAQFLMTGGIIPTPTAAFNRMETALEAGAEQARMAYTRVQDTSENIRDAFSQSATTAARGVIEINGKMFDLLRTQSEAAFTAWRSMVGANSLPDAMYVQVRAVRQACEATTAQWQDIAETAGRVAGEAMKPLRSALTGNAR